jgi:hypothetical protein
VAIVDRAIARNLDDRFPTAEAFRSALDAAVSEATDDTGAYSVVHGSGSANPDDLTMATPAPVPLTVAAPIPPADAPTVATWTPVPATASTQEAPQPPAPTPTSARAPTGTTVVMKRNQFAVVGGLLLALVAGVVILAVVALRRPSTLMVAPSQDSSTNAAAPAASPVPPPASDPVPASTAAAPPPPAPPPPRPLEISPPSLRLPPPTAATNAPAKPTVLPAPAAPAEPARTAALATPFRFDARAVVLDGDKRRERDATVRVADGAVTVTEKERNGKTLFVVPLDSLVGLTFSTSKQPLWNSPDGPAEAMKVEGGAFGFRKGGKNWFGLRTKDSLLVLRVDDDAIGRVTAGLQERTGLTLQRLVEPKD